MSHEVPLSPTTGNSAIARDQRWAIIARCSPLPWRPSLMMKETAYPAPGGTGIGPGHRTSRTGSCPRSRCWSRIRRLRWLRLRGPHATPRLAMASAAGQHETSGPPRRRSGGQSTAARPGIYDASSGVAISDGEGSGSCRRGEAEAQARCTAQGRSARSGDPPPPAITAALGGFGRAGPGRCLRPLPRPGMLVVGPPRPGQVFAGMMPGSVSYALLGHAP
jgi:hypothetical protein